MRRLALGAGLRALVVLLAALGAAMLAGTLRPAFAQQEVRTDQWHSVRDACPGGGTVQMRPVAVLGDGPRVESWRVDLRVPGSSTCSLSTPERLYLTIGGERAAGPFEETDGEEAGAQISLSKPTVERLAEADEVQIVERAIEGQVPAVFQADFQRLLQKAPSLARQREKKQTQESKKTESSVEDVSNTGPGDSQSGVSEEGASEEGGEVHKFVEEPPRLIGGMDRVQEILQYPEAAKQNELEGRVLLKLVVTKNGNVRRPEVTRGAHEALNKEAIRVARQLKFEPGKLRGEVVKTQVTLPVSFRLPQDEK